MTSMMSNEELANAIKEAFDMTRRVTPMSKSFDDVTKHLRELLEVQQARARAVEITAPHTKETSP